MPIGEITPWYKIQSDIAEMQLNKEKAQMGAIELQQAQQAQADAQKARQLDMAQANLNEQAQTQSILNIDKQQQLTDMYPAGGAKTESPKTAIETVKSEGNALTSAQNAVKAAYARADLYSKNHLPLKLKKN